jgi:polyisoprenoid-binding protein YceI
VLKGAAEKVAPFLIQQGPLPMRKILLALPLLAAAPLLAQSGAPMGPPGAHDASRVTAGTYTTDPSHSLIGWQVNHLGFNDYLGIFGDVAGTLTLDPANIAASRVDVTVPISKVTTASAGLTAHLLRAASAAGGTPDFFGPAPVDAHFVSTSVEADGADQAMIMGNLTLNGVTKPIMIHAMFVGAGHTPPMMGNKEVVGFHGVATVKRSDFGINGALPFVSDDVELSISVAFQK